MPQCRVAGGPPYGGFGVRASARSSALLGVRALARIRRRGYGLKAALRTPRFIRLKCYLSLFS